MLLDAIARAGFELETVSGGVLTTKSVSAPTIVIAEMDVVEATKAATDFGSGVIWLPVLVEPSDRELESARQRYGHVIVAPGRLSQVVALLEVVSNEIVESVTSIP